jgi:spermidine/putrescine-binding protein
MQFPTLHTLLLALFTLFTLVAAATQPQKSVIMTWSSDTPNHVVDQFKDAIVSAGGIITHEYKILKYVIF